MSDATKLPADQREEAMRSISADGLPQAIERQAAAGGWSRGAGGWAPGARAPLPSIRQRA
jgi:hypothetical protein